MSGKRKDQHQVGPVLRVAPLGELKVYAVTEDELEALGRGSPGSLYLNLGLAMLPVGIAFLITILSADIPSQEGKIFFVCSAVLFSVLGAISLVFAAHHHLSTKSLVQKIKDRMPPEVVGPAPDQGQPPMPS